MSHTNLMIRTPPMPINTAEAHGDAEVKGGEEMQYFEHFDACCAIHPEAKDTIGRALASVRLFETKTIAMVKLHFFILTYQLDPKTAKIILNTPELILDDYRFNEVARLVTGGFSEKSYLFKLQPTTTIVTNVFFPLIVEEHKIYMKIYC